MKSRPTPARRLAPSAFITGLKSITRPPAKHAGQSPCPDCRSVTARPGPGLGQPSGGIRAGPREDESCQLVPRLRSRAPPPITPGAPTP
ncbi:unnamed protein product [Lampetra planeri]